MPLHVGERNVLIGLRSRRDQADVLLREEALRDDHEQIDGQPESGEEDHQRGELPAQRQIETALIGAKHRIERAFAPLIEAAMFGLMVGPQKARGHHRRQRQRHDHRDEDRHRQRDREFAEQAADDSAHQQQRDQHRDQRNRDRHDRETDFLGALEGGRHRLFAFLDIAGDVLQHHDGVVDHEAHGNGQRHQRQIVERIAERPHQRAGAEQRQRHRDGRNHRGPEAAQEDEDHHHHQRDGQQQSELHVLHRGADGLGAVADYLDLDRGRDRGDQPRQRRLDLVDGLDDVGAGLFEHHQEYAALAVGPGRLFGVFWPGDGLANVANPQRPAVAVGDDDVVPVLGFQQLIVGVDGIGAGGAVDVALRTVDGGDRDLAAHVLHREALGDELGRIDLDTNGGLLLPADDDLRDT